MVDPRRSITSLGFFLLTAFSRIPFASRYLYHLDSGHFALALEKYDISIHQPHPPGYILYVMIGKFLHMLLRDANVVFITINVFFSGLSVALIFLFAEEVWDRKTGVLAGMFALSSPNLWFHGAVALSYPADCFFSILVAYLGWKILRDGPRSLWVSAVALGLAGGFRQSTMVFLFPLWFYSLRKARWSKVAGAIGVLALVSLAWFLLMIWSTGGLATYLGAFRELWVNTSGANSVMQWGWAGFQLFSKTLWRFSLYDLGAGMFVLAMAAYSLLRNKRLALLDRAQVLFFFLWIVPPVSFYLLIFIHPGNPGYALVLLPPFVLLSARSFVYLADDFLGKRNPGLYATAAAVLILLNVCMFLLPKSPVSFREIKDHDHVLSRILASLQEHDPENTAIFSRDYLFYNYRQVMYYLPGYRAYQVVMGENGSDGKSAVWGEREKYPMEHGVPLPENIDSFAAIVLEDPPGKFLQEDDVTVKEPSPGIFIVSGPSRYLSTLYPGFAPSHH